MKRLILASGSAQRKNLLRQLGIKFSVCKSNAREINQINTTCSALVKQNALLKAKSVAAKKRNAIVIGADTLVYIGNKTILGKPRSFAEAKKTLKILFKRPQWVYTGVAVIDTNSQKTVVEYEKTKVYMQKLTDDEIDRYHKKVKPFDKAGGFDIEGFGSLFIRRIEGCYTNVIGLPMAKTAKIFKSFGIKLLSLLCVMTLTGCTNEFNLATNRQESLMYGDDREVAIGFKVSQKIEEKYEINTNVEENERIERILNEIVEVSDRKDIVYFIKIINEDKMNAISLPGGYIYIFQGLMDAVENDDQLAGVIAHEVGHITARHGVKRLQAQYGGLLLQALAIGTEQPGLAAGVNFSLNSLFMAYSQRDEFESDKLSVKYMQKAGYDPKEMITFLGKLNKEFEDAPIRKYSYWRTHPFAKQRMAVVNKEINGELEFRDYIQLIGSDE